MTVQCKYHFALHQETKKKYMWDSICFIRVVWNQSSSISGSCLYKHILQVYGYNPAEQVKLSMVQVNFGLPVKQGAGDIRFYFLIPSLFLSLSILLLFLNQLWVWSGVSHDRGLCCWDGQDRRNYSNTKYSQILSQTYLSAPYPRVCQHLTDGLSPRHLTLQCKFGADPCKRKLQVLSQMWHFRKPPNMNIQDQIESLTHVDLAVSTAQETLQKFSFIFQVKVPARPFLYSLTLKFQLLF